MRIPFPFKGLSDAQTFADQEPLTTADALNVRPFDCKTGRIRGSQRAGTSKYLEDRAADAAIRWLGQVTYDGRKFSYAAGAGTSEWDYITPSASESQFGCSDRQGNWYILDGFANIVKVNPSGEKVWSLTPPTKDPRHRIRAVFVDLRDNVYCAVSEGGTQSLSRMWRFSQRKGEPPKQEWVVDIDGYVEKVLVKGDLVYTIENRPDRQGAQCVCRRGALSTGPTSEWATDVAYPANDFLIKADGSVVGCSPPFANRGLDPRYPAFTERTKDAGLRDILAGDYDRLVWRDNDASTLGVQLNSLGRLLEDGDTGLRDGDPVEFWPDSSAADRDLFLNATIAGQTQPRYNERGIGAKPSVYFRGRITLPVVADSLQSSPSASITQAFLDQHQGLVPGYQGAMWVMFLVMRPQEGGDAATAAAVQAVWGQQYTALGATDPRQSLLVNRNDSNVVQAGYGAFYDGTSSDGVGTGGGGTARPNQFQYGEAPGADNQPVSGNTTGTVVLTILCDGGMNASTPDSAATTHSLIRVNGKPLDRWETAAGGSTVFPGILGFSHNGAGTVQFRGDIARVIVLHAPGTTPPNSGPITHPHYPHNIHNAATAPVGNVYNAVDHFSATTMEKIEGMLAHEYGISHLLPGTGATTPTYNAVAPFRTNNDHGNYPHPYHRQFGPPRASQTNVRSEPYQMHTKNGCMWKLEGSKGDVQWVITGTSAEDGGGYGYSVGLRSDGNLYSVGPKLAVGSALIDGTTSVAGTGDVNLRCVQDLDLKGVAGFNTSVIIGQVGWIATLGTTSDDFATNRIRVSVDEFDNLYLPVNYPALTTPATLKVFAAAPDVSTGINIGNEILSYADGRTGAAYAALVAPSPPYRFGAAFDWDRVPATDARTARAEFCYLFNSQPSPRDPGLTKLRLVTATPVAEPVRRTTLLQVVNGTIWKFTSAGLSAPAGASTLAAPQLDATADYIDGAVISQKVYLTDGQKIVVFDPVLDTVTLLKSNDGGAVPEHCKLLFNWRGRLGLSRATDDPHNWHLSDMLSPRGWDRFGVPLLSTRAISGNNARAGLCPDIVNAAIPFTDNVLVWLCDHSWWAIVGDPANEGASAGMRQVSATTGGAFGRSWCLDPNGTAYVFGSRGSVYRMRPGGDPVNMTLANIDRRLTDVDLGDFRAELAWNTDDDGFHVFFIGAESTINYFWHRETDSWWSDTFAQRPTAVCVADGDDPDDRVLLIGGSDGYVRKWDRDAVNDDGEAIPTRVRIGPMLPEEADFEGRFSAVEAVLASDQNAVQVAVHASGVADSLGPRVAKLELQPGRNLGHPIRGSGACLWLVVEQSHAMRRWSIESIDVTVSRGGRKAVRA